MGKIGRKRGSRNVGYFFRKGRGWVTKTGTTDQTITVNYATSDGTAKVADGDYVAKSGALTFAPSDTSKQLTVTINGVNDAASISGTDKGSRTEDDVASATGSLVVSDVDDGQAHSAIIRLG